MFSTLDHCSTQLLVTYYFIFTLSLKGTKGFDDKTIPDRQHTFGSHTFYFFRGK